MARAMKARCLCGAVRFEGLRVDDAIHACHCSQCQRWTGGGPLYALRVSNVTVTGEDSIRAYRASDWGERAFCAICGTSLYWKMQGADIAYLPVGLLDDQSGLAVKEEIFVETRPEWLPPFDCATQSTEAEQKAALAAYLAKNEKEKPHDQT
jgi:hypothetical protein